MVQKKFTTALGIIVLAAIVTIIFTSLISAPSPQVFQPSGEKPLEEDTSSPKEQATFLSPSANDIAGTHNDDRIQTLEDQVKNLTAQIATLEQKYRDMNDKPAPRHDAESLPSAGTSIEDTVSLARERRQQLDELVSDRSDTREGDTAAASQQIRAAIRSPLLSLSSVLGVDCVASLCRIQAVHQGMGAQQKFVDTLVSKLNDGGWNPATEVYMDIGETSNELRSVIYVTREGHPLPIGNSGSFN